ncbi:MAG: O-antigen ligase family protein [Bacteroidaceae bacterium]|nr:O-antigen ligase family protein [Bacteroidaceae bacterium]
MKKLSLTFSPSESSLLLYWTTTWLMLQTLLTFNVFSFLLPLSLFTLGMCFLNLGVMGFLYLKRMELPYYPAAVMFFYMLYVIFTIINANYVKMAVYQTVQIVLLLILLEYYKSRYDMLLKVLALVYSACIYGNLMLMLLFPDWMFVADDEFRSFILGGNYNQMGCRFFCGIVASYLCVPYGKRWILNTVAVAAVSIITLIMVGSMTALSCIILLCVACLFVPNRLLRWGTYAFFVFYLLFQCFVCFSGESLYNNELASYLVEDVLGKDLTFTKRTTVWEASGSLFAESPLIGYGCVTDDWYLENLYSEAVGPHNFIYGVLLHGGVVLFLVFVCIAVMAFWRSRACEDRPALLLRFAFVTLLFMMCFEAYPFFFVFYMLCLLYYYPDYRQSCTTTPS